MLYWSNSDYTPTDELPKPYVDKEWFEILHKTRTKLCSFTVAENSIKQDAPINKTKNVQTKEKKPLKALKQKQWNLCYPPAIF